MILTKKLGLKVPVPFFRFSRTFSSTADRHFFVEHLENNVKIFRMNRPKARNAISQLFVQ